MSLAHHLTEHDRRRWAAALGPGRSLPGPGELGAARPAATPLISAAIEPAPGYCPCTAPSSSIRCSCPPAHSRLTDSGENLGLDGRGRIEAGAFADIVVFDPATVADRATYERPHQLAVGVRDVVVNGRVAVRDGQFAGEFPGRALFV